MSRARIALPLAAAVLAGALLVSGGERAGPRTPAALPGMPQPLFGVAVVGSGGTVAALDAYGNVVERRPGGPASPASVSVDPARQAAGSVDPGEAELATSRRDGPPQPLWRAERVTQRYLPGTNVLLTAARLDGRRLLLRSGAEGGAARRDRRWLTRARPLGPGAPGWARRLYRRSLLVLRALTDRRSGASVAGIREGWAYVWPRDAAGAALALSRSGYRAEARRVAHFLTGLDLEAAARFDGAGRPVPERDAQGDAAGWTALAARAAGIPYRPPPYEWRGRADYREQEAGRHLANAIAATGADLSARPAARRLVAEALRRPAAWDSAIAWAAAPFPLPELRESLRRQLLRIAAEAGPYGITPTASWEDRDPWTAPTAWTAWGLAALGERRAALPLLGALRRAATPLGLLPERVDRRTGLPASTTPLGWSHAFAILALRELWPGPPRG